MSDLELLDRGYATVMDQVVATGRAPHFTDLAHRLDLDLPTAKALVHELAPLASGWVHPGTDHIASFAPFNIQPTQYHVTIDGEHRWFAQCGFEALAIRWLVPGDPVRIDAPCLCCGEPMVVQMRDEVLVAVDPVEMVGYTSARIGGDTESRPFR